MGIATNYESALGRSGLPSRDYLVGSSESSSIRGDITSGLKRIVGDGVSAISSTMSSLYERAYDVVSRGSGLSYDHGDHNKGNNSAFGDRSIPIVIDI